MKKLCLLCAVLLAGCGGGNSYTHTPPPVAELPQAPPKVPDVFLARIETFVLDGRENTEPVDVDTLVVTAPDDQDPYIFIM